MAIRLVAIDLDGTLLNSRAEISPANQQALIDTAKRGVQIAVVTGRRFHSAWPVVMQIPFPTTLIASNGALIGTSEGKVLFRDFLPRDVAREALEAGREFRAHAVAIFDLPGRGQVVMQTGAASTGPLSWYLEKYPEYLSLVSNLEEAVEFDPVQIMFGGPPDHMAPLEPLLRASPVGPKVHLTWTRYFSRQMSILDVMNRNCSKGAALQRWAEHCGIDSSEVMAIGDNHNDLEMLQFSGRPVLMANCAPGWGAADWAVTRSNDEDGVAEALRSFVLAPE